MKKAVIRQIGVEESEEEPELMSTGDNLQVNNSEDDDDHDGSESDEESCNNEDDDKENKKT